jgi:hypothetical protein
MSQGPETTFKLKVYKFLDEFDNIWYYKTSDRFTRAIPDIIGSINGRFFALELKARGAKEKPHEKLQRHNLQLIEKSGGFSMLVRPENFEEFKGAFARLAQAA